ncbi:hypothetical protein [Futiania mangrovi]|uniref:Uncharacterized protein n=1 Tax=Futiania mangrovi TaxID=2959716 RepID=A0A9J6PE20_9PROT|nr:hypothetical protein [Futiania mangrovii]MCP1336913.1 hypothetical protein [Futiania mangrovii]
MTPVWSPRRLFLTVLPDADREAVVAQSEELARLLGIEIAGVLLEERDLFLAAGLPGTAEFGLVSRRVRPIAAAPLEAEIARSLAATARALETVAQATGCSVTLTRERSSTSEALSRALPEDLLVFAGPLARLDEPEVTRGLLAAAARSAGLLLPGPRRAPHGPVFAVTGTARLAGQMLPVLARLAPEGTRIGMLIGDAGAPEAGALATQAAEFGPRFDIRPAGGPDTLQAAALSAGAAQARLLIVAAEPAGLAHGRTLRALLRAAGCPVLLLRQES